MNEVVSRRFSTHTVSVNQPTKQCFATFAQVKSDESTLASLRSACGWVRLTGKQSTMKDSGIDRVTYVLWRCTEGVRKQGVIHVFDPIQSVQPTNTVMLRYTRISQKSGMSTLASLRFASGWVRLIGKQSTMKDSLVDRITYVLWRCTEGVRKQGVIQAFHRIQSVKSTNRVMLCYTRAKSSQCVNVGVADSDVCMWWVRLTRQAKQNEKISGVDGSLTVCEDAQKESENKAFIQVFHPIQSVKSTNAVMLRHTHIRQDRASQRWRSLA